jgi:hypothetical protein
VQDRIERLPILLDAITSKSRPVAPQTAGRDACVLPLLGRSALQLIENQFAMPLGRAMMLLARGHSFMPVIEFAEWRRWFSASR